VIVLLKKNSIEILGTYISLSALFHDDHQIQTSSRRLRSIHRATLRQHLRVPAYMFKKFNASEDVAGRQNVKSSVQRGIKAKIVEKFPKLEPFMEEIIPKKSQLSLVKWYPIPPFED